MLKYIMQNRNTLHRHLSTKYLHNYPGTSIESQRGHNSPSSSCRLMLNIDFNVASFHQMAPINTAPCATTRVPAQSALARRSGPPFQCGIYLRNRKGKILDTHHCSYADKKANFSQQDKGGQLSPLAFDRYLQMQYVNTFAQDGEVNICLYMTATRNIVHSVS